MKLKHLVSFASFFTLVALSGCTNQPAPILSPLNTITPIKSIVSTPEPTITPVKLADPTKGGVNGRIMLRSTNLPASDVAIYLGEHLPINNGESYVITIQENSSPHVPTDQNGRFGLVDIKPGTYALVLWTPKRTMVVADPKQPTEEFQVVIKPGQITDLGDILSDLP